MIGEPIKPQGGLTGGLIVKTPISMKKLGSTLLLGALTLAMGCESVAVLPRPTTANRRLSSTITNTRITNGSRDIRAESLRSGDRVSVRLDRNSVGEQYANTIRVEDRTR
jgi:hypothetical protein